MSESYTYAVARIRANELALFNDQAIEQLLAAKSYEECIRLLQDKGWGGMEANPTAESLLAEEREKTWALMRELVPDLSVFDVFLYTNDYHNLKAAIKLVCTGSEDFGLFISHGTIDHRELLHAVQERDWGSLPDPMRGPAEEAYTALAQTRDGQLCDIILDRAALDAVYAAGKASRDELVRRYAELTVAAADIKTAVRCARTGKPMDFIRRALAECDSLSVSRLPKGWIRSATCSRRPTTRTRSRCCGSPRPHLSGGAITSSSVISVPSSSRASASGRWRPTSLGAKTKSNRFGSSFRASSTSFPTSRSGKG